MSNQDAKFGQFKTKISEQLGRGDVKKLSTLFEFSAKVCGEIEEAKNPGLALLNVLEKKNKIGADIGVDDLCEAFDFCELHKAKGDAAKQYEEFKNSQGGDSPDYPDYMDKDLKCLRTTIRGQLTEQDCFELATCLGLDASTIERIRDSRIPDEELIQILHDRGIITETQIGCLLFALEHRGLRRVATLITGSRKGETTPARASLASQGSTVDESSKQAHTRCRLCGEAEFEEFTALSSQVVSLQCQRCSAEWVPGEESGKVSLMREENKFSYKVPLSFNVSLLKKKVVRSMSDLKPGDHIVFERLGGLYDHHAILVSTDPKRKKLDVFHWTSDNFAIVKKALHLGKQKPITIKREPVGFPEEGVQRMDYNQEIDPPDMVIARAWTMSKKPGQVYSVTDNNCETFAVYCKVGKCVSQQGTVVKDILPPMMKWLVSYFER